MTIEKEPTENLLCIAEAAAKGIERVRLPYWANPMDHLKIDIIDGHPGPWLHLYSPINQGCNGKDPVSFVWALERNADIYERVYEAYAGPLPDSDEYQQASKFASRFYDPDGNFSVEEKGGGT